MLRSILIVSRDQRLLDTRVLVLKSSGYSTVGTTSIDDALKLATAVQPSVAIVCHTLPESEQAIFVNALICVCPNIFIMRLHEGEVNPHRLVADCELFFTPKDVAKHMRAKLSNGFSSNPQNGQLTDTTIVQ
jgi:hypothetical protein